MNNDTKSAFEFFKRHAGYVVGSRAIGALRLAKAEQEAIRRDWTCTWQDDEEGDLGDHDYWCGKGSKCRGHEVLGCVLKDASGKVLASLWGIIDPDRLYGRVVEAELAQEALYTERHEAEQTRESYRYMAL